MKKVAFFSTGIPDPTQGGSGIFNYYFVKRLLEKNILLDCFFRVNSNFLKYHTHSYHFDILKKKINSINFVFEKNNGKFLKFGIGLLKAQHHFNICQKTVVSLKNNYNAYISLDLGWAMALDNFDNCLSILGDPYHARVLDTLKGKFLSPINYYRKLKALSCTSSKTMQYLSSLLNNRKCLGIFSRHHAEEYQGKGINCELLDWFSPEVNDFNIKKNFFYSKEFNLCHLGDLETTASRKSLDFLENSLEVISKIISKKIVISFVGRFKERKKSLYPNIEFKYLGHVDDLSKELNKYDALISFSDYSAGIRTRIITGLSHGIPCIAHFSASFGLHKLKHGYDILFCKNSIEFANNINMLINDKYLQMKISENSRISWLKYFNPKTNVDKILKIVNC